MDKRGKVKAGLIISIVLVLIIAFALIFIMKSDKSGLSENESINIVKNITDNEIIKVDYYEKCYIQNKDYGKTYVVITKLKEKYDGGLFGEFEYKYYFLGNNKTIIFEVYNPTSEIKVCEKLE